MTQLIDLQPVPNQRITTTLDGNRYVMTFKNTNDVMSVTIVRNDNIVFTNLRTVAETPIIPYRFQEQGNFIFETENDELPDYRRFGDTQFLIYASQSELEGFRRG